jgi:hypothetical protein
MQGNRCYYYVIASCNVVPFACTLSKAYDLVLFLGQNKSPDQLYKRLRRRHATKDKEKQSKQKMIRERRTHKWICKFELLATGNGSEQIAPRIERGWWSNKEIYIEEQSTPFDPSLSAHTTQPNIVSYIAKMPH